MFIDLQERQVARALCRREPSVNVAKVALPLWRYDDKKRETFEDQIRLEYLT